MSDRRTTRLTPPLAPPLSPPFSPPVAPVLVPLLEHLRATVGRYVVERRDAGAPVERVLVELKAMVRQAVARERLDDPTGALMSQAVRWAIVAYYDAAPAAPAPRTHESTVSSGVHASPG